MADKKFTNEYKRNNYAHLTFILRRDSALNGDLLREYAWTRGESLNGFLKRAIEETIERDKKKNQR